MKESTKKGLDYLQAKYPRSFDLENPLPLAVGTYDFVRFDFFANLPDGVDWKNVRKALVYFTGKDAYRACLTLNAPRYDLRGRAVGVVTQEHLDIGKRKLDEQLAKKKPRKKSKVAVVKSLAKQTEETKPRKPKGKKVVITGESKSTPTVTVKKKRAVVIPQKP